VRVRFWGVRGSIPTPGPTTLRYGGNTPCVEVRSHGTLIILDAGSGIRELGNALAAAGESLTAHLLITHTHWDHVQGFPFFSPAYKSGNTLHIYGCQGAGHSLEEVLAGQMELAYFPVAFKDMGAEVRFHEVDEGEFSIDGLRVRTMYSNHPGLCLLYRIEERGASGPAVAYLSDTEAYDQLVGPDAAAEATQYVGLKPGIDARLARFARNADLVIVDCPYTEDEYRERQGWGHGSVDAAVQIGLDAGARRLALFHHDPSHSDDMVDAMIAHARELVAEVGAPMEVFGAREGQELEV
jgi:phosphoribosyl 1,2-cyclic phosphodiesterase